MLLAILVLLGLLETGVFGQSAEAARLIAESKAEQDQQHYDSSVTLAQKAIDISRAAADNKGLAASLNRLSSTYFYSRKLDLALATAQQAIAAATQAGDHALLTRANGLAADAMRDSGNLEQARIAYEKQLEYIRLSGDRKEEAINMRMRAVLYRLMGDYEHALPLAVSALAIARELKDPSMEAACLFIEGVIENEQKQYPAALVHFNAALQISSITSQMRLQILRGVGNTYCLMKDNGHCMEFTRQQLEEAIASGNPYQVAWGYFNLALPQHQASSHGDAYNSNLKALNYLRTTGYDPFDEWHFTASVGQELMDLGRDTEALAYFEEAIGMVEKLRQGLVPSEQAMAQAASAHSTKQLFDSTIDLLFKRDPRKAFQIHELARARAFLSILAESNVHLRNGLSSSEQERETAQFARIAAIQKELWQPRQTEALQKQKAAELESAENDLESLRLEIRGSNPKLAAVQYPKPLGIEQIQREVLKAGTTLIEYSLGTERSFVWAVTRERSISAILPPAKEIEKLVSAFRRSLSASVSGLTARQSENEVARMSAQLYDKLLKPVERMLAPNQSLIIVPDGVLYYVPFEALSASGRAGFLMERFPIAYAPSATSLAAGESNPRPTGSKLLFAMGDPVYAARGTSGQRGPSLSPLPYTRDEIMGISSLFPKEQSTIYLGTGAREEAVKTEALDKYKYIHFATHGIMDEKHPGRSGLALSPSAGMEDGILQVNEIVGLRLNADLVTLSACGTGLGELAEGEGMLGLVRTFLYAGASSVAVSLWSVNDAATATMMKDFYKGLSRGVSPNAALRQAKLSMLRQTNITWRHPHYWAPFVLWLR